MYLELVVDDEKRRGRHTKRLMDLAIEYVGYNPDKYFPVGSLELKDVMHVLQGLDATLADDIKNVRFKWTKFSCRVVVRLGTNWCGCNKVS